MLAKSPIHRQWRRDSTDNLTDLVWLKNANCFGTANWQDALSAANSLANGSCGLSDGSAAGDWRLPNINEISSLINWHYTQPALSDTTGTLHWKDGDPFSFPGCTTPKFHDENSFYCTRYWSSTTDPYVIPNEAYAIYLESGDRHIDAGKGDSIYYVWPVRDKN